MTQRRGAGGFGIIFFMIALIIFASGAIVVYTVFMKPENMSTVPSLVSKSVVVQVEQVSSTLQDGHVFAVKVRDNFGKTALDYARGNAKIGRMITLMKEAV